MQFHLPDQVKDILDKFQKSNYQIYIVGGAVRDLLMDRTVKDWDFTTNAKPEEILKLFPDGFYDNKFGTVGIQIQTISEVDQDISEVYEVTTMRKEGKYEDFRHPGAVKWTNKIGEDLARRDFTINAMALSFTFIASATKQFQDQKIVTSSPAPPSDNQMFTLIDPFNGQDDITNRLIRAVGNPSNRFIEDALRLIRTIRIATELEFDIERETFLAMQKNAELISKISWERIRDELFKLLTSVNPYIGIIKLREAGILKIILPELEACFGIIQKGEKKVRVYDIGEHSLLTLKLTPSSDPLVRFAALLHDVGKVPTFKQDNGNVTFYGHDIAGGKIVNQIATKFRLSRKDKDKLYKLVRYHLFTVDEKQTDSSLRRFIRNVGIENLDNMFALREGDRLGGGTQTPTSWRLEQFKSRVKKLLEKPFNLQDLKVNGHNVMKALSIPPGPKVGKILNILFEEVLEDTSKNQTGYLLQRIKQLDNI